MLKLCRVTKVKVLYLVLVYVFKFNLFEFSAAILNFLLTSKRFFTFKSRFILQPSFSIDSIIAFNASFSSFVFFHLYTGRKERRHMLQNVHHTYSRRRSYENQTSQKVVKEAKQKTDQKKKQNIMSYISSATAAAFVLFLICGKRNLNGLSGSFK